MFDSDTTEDYSNKTSSPDSDKPVDLISSLPNQPELQQTQNKFTNVSTQELKTQVSNHTNVVIDTQETSSKRKSRLNKVIQRIHLKYVLTFFVVIAVFFSGILIGSDGLLFNFFQSEQKVQKITNFEDLSELISVLKENYDGEWSTQRIDEGLKNGLIESLGDPYTILLSPEEAKEYTKALSRESTGVGLNIEPSGDGNFEVTAPINGSPAAAAGLRAKDKIIAIDGASVKDLGLTDVQKKLDGQVGSSVTLNIDRQGVQLTVKMNRARVYVPSISGKIYKEQNLGYIRVSRFAVDTESLLDQVVQSFSSASVDKIILDLRNNSGGEVSAAAGMSSYWIDKDQVIVTQKLGNKRSEVSTTVLTDPPFKNMKTIVLINQSTASSAEIAALALREYRGVKIIGEKSFGKGSLQRLIKLKDGSLLRVTVGRWYSAKGNSIDKVGVNPDQVISQNEEDSRNKVDSQFESAFRQLVE